MKSLAAPPSVARHSAISGWSCRCYAPFPWSACAGIAVLLVMIGLLTARPAFGDFDNTTFAVDLMAQAVADDTLIQDRESHDSLLPGSYTYDASASQSGSTASGDLEVSVAVQPLPEMATISVKADAETSVPAGVPTEDFAGGYLDGSFSVSFSVPETACVRVTAQGTMSTTGGYALLGYGVGPDIQVATGHDTHGPNQSVNIDTTAAVPTGVLHIRVSFTANAYSDPDEPILQGNMAIDLTITVTVLAEDCSTGGNEDCEADTYFWEGLNGDYDDASNWEPECVPGEGHTTVFDKDQTYTVDFGNEEASRALVDRGSVSFSQGSYTLPGGSVASPALMVGNDSTDFAYLDFIEGHKLTTGYAAIGKPSGTNAWLVAASGGNFEVTEQLVVGGAGQGELSVLGNGRMNILELLLGTETGGHGTFGAYGNAGDGETAAFVSAMAAGMNGVGVVEVFGHIVYVARATLGVNDGAEGSLTVRAESGYGQFEFEELIVGDSGMGTVTVEQGGKLQSLIWQTNGFSSWARLGNKSSGFGEVLVTDCGALLEVENLTVAHEGGAKLIVAEGGSVKTALLGIAEGSTGQGQVLVEGACEDGTPSILEVTGGAFGAAMSVGFLGTGHLKIADGGLVTCGNADVGGLGGGTGLVLVEGAESIWRIDDSLRLGAPALENEEAPAVGNIFIQDGLVSTKTLIIHPGSGIYGNGTLQLELGPENVIEGTVSAGLFLAPLLPAKHGFGPATRAAGHGTLLIDGGLPMSGGVLEVSISGTEPGQYDRIVVEGDVDLDTTAIRLVFTDGYAPQTGAGLPFLVATGAITATETVLNYTGLLEGFDYRIEIQDGAIGFEALSDGVTDGSSNAPMTDVNGDGAVDAVDIQYVINAALGLAINPLFNADVNRDLAVNAVDVQLMINAVLGRS